MLASHEKADRVPTSSPEQDAEYRRNVNSLMETGSSALISNGLPQHAAALLECFFRNANTEVKIVSENLQRDIYDAADVLNSCLGAVRRGISVQIIVRNSCVADSHFANVFKQIVKKGEGKVFLKDAIADNPICKEVTQNFAVMDRRAFRFETTPGQCKAFASMNNSEIAGKLGLVFDRLYSSLLEKENLVDAPSI